ncbi:hypothetical protein [Brachybacterium phenoliresistens]|uniref:hypothetical protein n=1 Tax=Brachybacterium phenoliresistens TaxID=396014 RepID=UPI0031D556B2
MTRTPHAGGIGRRPVLGAAGAGAVVLLLAACGEDSEELEAGLVAVRDRGGFAADWLEELDGGPDQSLELPGVRYTVTAVGRPGTVRGSDAADLGLPVPAEPYRTMLRPARGEVLHVAVVTSTDPTIMAPDVQPDADRTERIVRDGHLVDRTMSALDLDPPRLGGAALVVASVPEDAAPDHLVLEVTTAGRVQRMSLIDGSRTSSDLEPWYERSVAVDAAARWWQRSAADLDAPAPHLAGFVTATGLVPAVHGMAWPEKGHAVLALSVTRLPAPPGTTDRSTLELILADGTPAPPLGRPTDQLAMIGESSELACFQVPEGIESATARLHLALEAADGTAHDLGVEDVAVTVTREDR